tara:strand:- start:1916 stop:2179 length:264 start_codon:yes stop_codon:yes gene_type:complete
MSLLLVDLLILVVQEVAAKALVVIAQFATALVILLAQRVDIGDVILQLKSVLKLTQASTQVKLYAILPARVEILEILKILKKIACVK